ncbi:MAG TPA: TIM barrel protein [Bryobacteraceae bacterium]|nr:TIM barrel protein [Bryobacteraceae bacterium]
MTRRNLLMAAAATVARASAAPRSKMGGATTSYMGFARPRDTYAFLEHVHELGGAGIQASLSSLEPAALKKLRAQAEQWEMYVEVMAPLPKEDTAAFERYVAAAKEAGAICLRTGALSGRRYETFHSLAEWEEFRAGAKRSIERALPILARHRLPIGIENHKDWTLDEMVPLLEQYSSEWLGACLDTGNNISLLDDPMAVVERLARYTVCTHIKDMGVEAYKDGFLLSEMPLGEGMLDMKRVVSTILAARPKVHMTLEMITRDPLQVPCLTERYWVTFPQRNGVYLARTLGMVYSQRGRQALPRVTGLPRDAQLGLEEDNVKQSLYYARQQLGL